MIELELSVEVLNSLMYKNMSVEDLKRCLDTLAELVHLVTESGIKEVTVNTFCQRRE